ncbi:MAG: hypothetical protein IKI78_01570, partial [Clostridia bacterium]|nr:hypothetical protein [Clostridia bacterium]
TMPSHCGCSEYEKNSDVLWINSTPLFYTFLFFLISCYSYTLKLAVKRAFVSSLRQEHNAPALKYCFSAGNPLPAFSNQIRKDF